MTGLLLSRNRKTPGRSGTAGRRGLTVSSRETATQSILERVSDGASGERFGDQVVQLLGAAEHRSERICRCVSEERRPQRRRWAAWAPKIRRWLRPRLLAPIDCLRWSNGPPRRPRPPPPRPTPPKPLAPPTP